MICRACGLHELRYAICDRWSCPNLVVRTAIEGAMICVGMPDDPDFFDDTEAFILDMTTFLDEFACSTCGKYPCECDDC